MKRWLPPLLLCLLGCPGPAPTGPAAAPGPPGPGGPGAQPETVTIAVVGTSDLHGHVEPDLVTVKDAAGAERTVARGGLPLLGGYLANLRRRMPVLLLDAGDLFQGTLVSNLDEGQVVIEAYNAIGYTAAAIGNHEFDYGPVGPRATPRPSSDDDPTGALKARIAAARFPVLSSNVIDEATGRPVAWPNASPSRLIDVPGVPGLRVGIIGGTAEDTPRTTNPLNLRGLRIEKVAPAARAEAEALRRQGAALVLLSVHEGGDCKSFADPRDLGPCQAGGGRLLRLAQELQGAVDAIVGGHSHAGVAHLVGEVPVVQSFALGRYFGRIDLTLRRTGPSGWTLDRARTRVHPPTEVCQVVTEGAETFVAGAGGRRDRCIQAELEGKVLVQARYEGAPVEPAAPIAAVIAPFSERAAARRAEPIGKRLARRLAGGYRSESELGRLLADLIREGAESATGKSVDFAFQNGGGIRAQLPVGDLRYGDLYEVLPFDNRLALIRMPGSALLELLRRNLRGGGGALTPSGLTGEARCAGGKLEVRLADRSGKPIDPERTYTIAASDFLAAGGDNFGAVLGALPPGAVTYYDDLPPLRELVLRALKARPVLEPPPGPRLRLQAPRPMKCEGEALEPSEHEALGTD